MNATSPRTIRARIADEAIGKVMQFFDGTLAQTLHEVLQNARRSGATRVDIERANGRITVRDDGRGIADPRTLLAFGKSGWRRDLQDVESPAGMGIFSLARRTPRILSKVSGRRAWAIELHQDHFIGRESAPVTQAEPGFDGDHGTDVTFSTLPTDKDWIPGVIAAALRHYPIPARVNGRKAEQIDFLAEAVRTLTWRGLRIGVFAADRDPYVAPTINFHGLEVRCDELPQVHALPGADAKATRFWWTGVDVVDCPDLELTLPTRTAIVQTPFIGELVTEAQRAIYRTITSAGHSLRLAYETREAAAAAGVPLPRDPQQLTPWTPANAREDKGAATPRNPDLAHAILVDDAALDTAQAQTLAWAARETGTLGRYWQTERGLTGYDWYDRLPRVAALNVHLIDGGEPAKRANGQPAARGEVDAIEIELALTGAGRTIPEPIRIPASAALLSPEPDTGSEPEPAFAVRRGGNVDAGALENALVDAYFRPTYDGESDSLDTQMREYRRAVAYLVTETLESRDAAADRAIRTLVESAILPAIADDSSIDIEIRNGELATLRRL